MQQVRQVVMAALELRHQSQGLLLLMLAVVVEVATQGGQNRVVLVVLVAVALVLLPQQQPLEPQTQVVVEVVADSQPVLVVQVAPVSSSSRPINNEDKWKPKSIGCMESTPQCTC
jgi:hypothetical protein